MGGITHPRSTEKVGDIKKCAVNAVPYGWLKCDGAAISRTAYAALFAAIGTTWGAGDGATTFNVPDFRGYFLRGFDNGAGVDVGRVFASAQADDLGSHQHGLGDSPLSGAAGGQTHIPVGNAASTYQTAAVGGAETRPKNKAVLICIKY